MSSAGCGLFGGFTIPPWDPPSDLIFTRSDYVAFGARQRELLQDFVDKVNERALGVNRNTLELRALEQHVRHQELQAWHGQEYLKTRLAEVDKYYDDVKAYAVDLEDRAQDQDANDTLFAERHAAQVNVFQRNLNAAWRANYELILATKTCMSQPLYPARPLNLSLFLFPHSSPPPLVSQVCKCLLWVRMLIPGFRPSRGARAQSQLCRSMTSSARGQVCSSVPVILHLLWLPPLPLTASWLPTTGSTM